MIFPTYPIIDPEKTGERIRQMVDLAGYSIRDIQEYLHLSCPQPIYRWCSGKVMPSLDHLVALSTLLHVPMDYLIMIKTDPLRPAAHPVCLDALGHCWQDNSPTSRAKRLWFDLYRTGPLDYPSNDQSSKICYPSYGRYMP